MPNLQLNLCIIKTRKELFPRWYSRFLIQQRYTCSKQVNAKQTVLNEQTKTRKIFSLSNEINFLTWRLKSAGVEWKEKWVWLSRKIIQHNKNFWVKLVKEGLHLAKVSVILCQGSSPEVLLPAFYGIARDVEN